MLLTFLWNRGGQVHVPHPPETNAHRGVSAECWEEAQGSSKMSKERSLSWRRRAHGGGTDNRAQRLTR